MSLSGDTNGFTIVNGGPTTLAPGEQTTITIRFDPLTLGEKTAQLDITSNDPDEGTVSVPLFATVTGVPEISVAPMSIDFGTVTVGDTATEEVTVTNDGTANLSLNSTMLAGPDAGEFGGTTVDETIILEPGESVTGEVTFSPTSGGAKSASIRLASNDPGQPTTVVQLSGTGEAFPEIAVDPASIDFGNVTVGESATESVTALEGIDLDIGRGEFVSVVGPSGCGKTTLLHIAAGILDPTEGSVQINGVDVGSPQHKRKEVGLVFQHPVALEWRNVRKNLLLPVQILKENGAIDREMDYYRDRADELLSLVGLDGFGDSYPNELSGGMQQRVTISQALIYNPSVLLMDEPFGSLDAMTKDELNLELLRIWRETEKTIMFITHDLDEAIFLSDRVVVLSPRPGQIADVIDIDLDRPRNEETRGSERFVELSAELHRHFKGLS